MRPIPGPPVQTPTLGATRTIEVDPIVIDRGGRRTIIAGEQVVTGSAPPTNWWPWVIGALVLGGLWYFSRERGGRGRGPLAE